jgi:hypothetical protein
MNWIWSSSPSAKWHIFPADAKELAGIYGEIRAELASQYFLAYESNNPRRDGRACRRLCGPRECVGSGAARVLRSHSMIGATRRSIRYEL